MQHADSRVALYSAVDDTLTHYDVDVRAATLTRRDTLATSAKTQYAWPHPKLPVLYVTSSSGGPRVPSDFNRLQALAIGPDGALSPHGEARVLPRRAVHLCIDPQGRYALNGHNHPRGGLTVHRLENDGAVGAEVPQDTSLDFGTYPHQVMVFPSGQTAMLVDRGNKAQPPKAEEPGALRTFGFEQGLLSTSAVVAPAGGFGFGPRHIAFHPNQPWLYASDERTNRLYMFRFENDRPEPLPAFSRDTLREPTRVHPRQIAGPIHVHPSGRWVYVVNRADHTAPQDGLEVFTGGENNVAVFAIDAETGEPTLQQHADTRSFHVRTFACDPSGGLLVTASIKALAQREGETVRHVPAALSVFRVEKNGTLDYVRQYAVETPPGKLQYWMGMVALDAHTARSA